MSETLRVEAREGWRKLTLNRPDKLNAWTQKMDEEVGTAIRAAAADESVRVIILTGAGKGFCAGADMTLLSAISQESQPSPRPS